MTGTGKRFARIRGRSARRLSVVLELSANFVGFDPLWPGSSHGVRIQEDSASWATGGPLIATMPRGAACP
ncbi:hypothetical protein QFZ65_002149 [Arthrobacter sp. B3I9]|nr:hypothetical protein [Arthrobacter sp. B3I9]